MKKITLVVGLTAALAGCSPQATARSEDSPKGGMPAAGTALRDSAPAPEQTGQAREAVATSGAAPAAASNPLKKIFDREPKYREVTLPAGTVLPLEMTSTVGSNTSRLEEQVRATLRRAVSSNGVEVLPAGTVVLGHVTSATPSARVKGRATVAFRFNQLDLPGDGGRMTIRTATVSRMAPATKKADAAKIGGGAAGGAIIGGLLGGGSGAAKGAAIGGGAGTAVVLSTRGKDVHVAAGTPVSVRLTAPLTVRVK